MPGKVTDIEIAIKKRFFKAVRFIIADFEKFEIKNISEFATKIGWTTQSMSRANNNDNFSIPDQYKYKLIIQFGVDADWLMTGRGVLVFHSEQMKSEVQKKVHKS